MWERPFCKLSSLHWSGALDGILWAWSPRHWFSQGIAVALVVAIDTRQVNKISPLLGLEHVAAACYSNIDILVVLCLIPGARTPPGTRAGPPMLPSATGGGGVVEKSMLSSLSLLLWGPGKFTFHPESWGSPPSSLTKPSCFVRFCTQCPLDPNS